MYETTDEKLIEEIMEQLSERVCNPIWIYPDQDQDSKAIVFLRDLNNKLLMCETTNKNHRHIDCSQFKSITNGEVRDILLKYFKLGWRSWGHSF
jgi:hypothetical protein